MPESPIKHRPLPIAAGPIITPDGPRWGQLPRHATPACRRVGPNSSVTPGPRNADTANTGPLRPPTVTRPPREPRSRAPCRRASLKDSADGLGSRARATVRPPLRGRPSWRPGGPFPHHRFSVRLLRGRVWQRRALTCLIVPGLHFAFAIAGREHRRGHKAERRVARARAAVGAGRRAGSLSPRLAR